MGVAGNGSVVVVARDRGDGAAADSAVTRNRRRLVGVAVLCMLGSVAILVRGGDTQAALDSARQDMGWAVVALALTEGVLGWGGRALVVVAVGRTGISRAFRLRRAGRKMRWADLVGDLDGRRGFWLGFWLTTASTCGTCLVVVAVMARSLPVTAWGAMAGPALLLVLTMTMRQSLARAVRSYRVDGAPSAPGVRSSSLRGRGQEGSS